MLRASFPQEYIDESLSDVMAPTFLKRLKQNLDRSEPFKIKVDPKTGRVPKRAAVAIILSLNPTTKVNIKQETASLKSLYNDEWAQNANIEITYIKRAKRKGDRWSGQVTNSRLRFISFARLDFQVAAKIKAKQIGKQLKGKLWKRYALI